MRTDIGLMALRVKEGNKRRKKTTIGKKWYIYKIKYEPF